jgi:uncharacterized membrane protein
LSYFCLVLCIAQSIQTYSAIRHVRNNELAAAAAMFVLLGLVPVINAWGNRCAVGSNGQP